MVHHRGVRPLLTLFLVLAAGCAAPRVSGDGQEDVAAIHRLADELRSRTRAGDVDAAMNLFTDDAVYLRPADAADIGEAAIRRHWQEGLEDMVVDIEWRAVEVEVSGNLAFARGDVTWRGTPRAGGRTVTSEQRYVWVLRREAGEWRLARYMRHAPPRPGA